MRPSGVTAAASVKTSPAPPTARVARWTKCHSFAKPSREEYWHMGETPMRLRTVMSRRRNSSNKCGMIQSFDTGILQTDSTLPLVRDACRRVAKAFFASHPGEEFDWLGKTSDVAQADRDSARRGQQLSEAPWQ